MARGGGLVPLVWALFLGGLALLIWGWSPGTLPVALLAGAAVASACVGAVLAVRARIVGDHPLQRVPDLSFATAIVAVALTAMLVGATAGLWLVYLGAGFLAFGLVQLVRERRAERRRP
jgi:hypothetical protein